MKTTTTTTTKTKTNNYKNKNENNKNKTGTNVILSSTQARHIQYVHHGTPTQQTRVKSLGQSSGMSTRLSRLPPPPRAKLEPATLLTHPSRLDGGMLTTK